LSTVLAASPNRKITVLFDEGKHVDKKTGKETTAGAVTDNGKVSTTNDENGKPVEAVAIEGSTITIYKGMIDQMDRDNNNPSKNGWSLGGKATMGLSFMEIMSAAFGHEIEHTTSENMIIVNTKGRDAAEVTPVKKSDDIIKETKSLPKNKR
jgi:hypothetical protein